MKYYSEVMLLTKQVHSDELRCWLDWHLNVIKFDHVVLFDNESPINVQEIISNYPHDKIEYHLIKGYPDQNKLYNDHIKESNSEWSIALDDDEFLYIKDELTVNDLIKIISHEYHKYNKFYVLWVNLFSKDFIEKRSDLFINTHTYYSYEVFKHVKWSDNGFGKCFINTGQYEYYYNYYKRAHIPWCLNGNDRTLLAYGNDYRYYSCITYDHHVNLLNKSKPCDLCFIAHYQFKSNEDWILKCNRGLADNQYNFIKGFIDKYSDIYHHCELFKELSCVKDRWQEYVRSKS